MFFLILLVFWFWMCLSWLKLLFLMFFDDFLGWIVWYFVCVLWWVASRRIFEVSKFSLVACVVRVEIIWVCFLKVFVIVIKLLYVWVSKLISFEVYFYGVFLSFCEFARDWVVAVVFLIVYIWVICLLWMWMEWLIWLCCNCILLLVLVWRKILYILLMECLYCWERGGAFLRFVGNGSEWRWY